MKKILLFGALALCTAGSWAFYPKAAEPGEYMMVIGRVYTNYSLIIISPTGETVTQVIDDSLHGNSGEKQTKAYLQLTQAEIHKINELKQMGWKVVNAFADRGAITYLLEK